MSWNPQTVLAAPVYCDEKKDPILQSNRSVEVPSVNRIWEGIEINDSLDLSRKIWQGPFSDMELKGGPCNDILAVRVDRGHFAPDIIKGQRVALPAHPHVAHNQLTICGPLLKKK